MTNKDQKINMLIIIPLLITFTLTLTITYAFFKKTIKTDSLISIKTGTKYIGIYGENKNNIELGTSYTFTIENRGINDSNYELYLENDTNNTITSGSVTCNIISTGKENNKMVTADKDTLISGSLKVGEKDTITMTLSSTETGVYKAKLKLRYKEYLDGDISGANPPELVGDMIPVVYSEESSTWIKSDTKGGNWYDYENQKWANAVTIKDSEKRAQYKNADINTPITLEDINTFFVWIPRYSYTLGNNYGYQIEGALTPSIESPGAFDIKFVKTSTIDTGSGQYTGNNPENYYTPSSFCWGDTCDEESSRNDSANTELPGIWISKFELTEAADQNITSLPNSSLRYAKDVDEHFRNIQTKMNNTNGTTNYGFYGTYDTHLIKNTEWGAMAYLSQSKYGKYGNKDFSGANKEIYQNTADYQTGCSYGAPPDGEYSKSKWYCKYTYDIKIDGTGASTTGNIYGIYDTSGGGEEYVMANYNHNSGESKNSSGSGFTNASSFPARRYYNLYKETDAEGYIKGDATGKDKTAGFYQNLAYNLTTEYPWFFRGGEYIDGRTGIFQFNNTSGNSDMIGVYSWFSTRIAIVNAK